MRLSRICAESGLMPTLSPRHMLPLLKFRHLLSGRCRVKRPFSTTLSFRSRPAFCISLIPKLPAYLFTPSKGVVLSRNSSAPSEGVQFSAFSAHLLKVRNLTGPSVGSVPAFLFPAAFSHLPKVRSFPAFSAHLLKVRNRPGPSVGPVPAFSFPAAFSHLPKVCSFPAFSAHLLKVRNRPGPSVGSVPAFLFPAAFSHLPKVCSFPAFSAHLPKVRNRPGPSVGSVPAFLFPAASFHLPKAGQIRQYPYHLWKVSTSIFSATAADSAFLCRCGKGPGRQYCLENL